jgi:hypothetical protein
VTLPTCTCGGTLRPPLKLQKGALCAVPDVTDAEEEEANARADAAILRCDRCWTRIVLHTNDRPARYAGTGKRHPKPSLEVFDVTPQKEPTK